MSGADMPVELRQTLPAPLSPPDGPVVNVWAAAKSPKTRSTSGVHAAVPSPSLRDFVPDHSPSPSVRGSGQGTGTAAWDGLVVDGG